MPNGQMRTYHPGTVLFVGAVSTSTGADAISRGGNSAGSATTGCDSAPSPSAALRSAFSLSRGAGEGSAERSDGEGAFGRAGKSPLTSSKNATKSGAASRDP